MSHATSAMPAGVVLDWRHGQLGPLAPCRTPTVCRSPVKDVPCHNGRASAWITTHACDAADLARLIGRYTPGRGEPR